MCTAEKLNINEEYEEIAKSLTRQCNKVIKSLYKSRLSNKDLASTLGVSASALSNSLQKIKSSHPDLLVIEQYGRNIYYSLSEMGSKYTELYLMNDRIISMEEKSSKYVQECVILLNEMKKKWGKNWNLELDELLLRYTKLEIEDIDECFRKFIHVVERIYIEERWEEMNSLYSLLSDATLKGRIEIYFERIMGIKHLCIIDDSDWKIAYGLIDNFFENSGELVRKELIEKVEMQQISSENINRILYSLNRMVNEAEKKMMKKEEFYNEWECLFVSHERLLYYIAEKFVVR